MAERQYQGAGIGVERMNEMIEAMRRAEMTIAQIALHLDICERSVKKYLVKLTALGKVAFRLGDPDRRFKHYSTVPGVESIPVPALKWTRRRPLKDVKLKTGPKPRRNKEAWNAGLSTVRTVPAQQIGIQRDPLIAALFGGARC
jgi:hypothetical protein